MIKQLHNLDMNMHNTLTDTVSTLHSKYLHGTAQAQLLQHQLLYGQTPDDLAATHRTAYSNINLLQHRDGNIFSPAGITA